MFWQKIKQTARDVLDLIFPNPCVVCGENLSSDDDAICLACLYRLPRTNYHRTPDNPLEKRFWGKADVERATAFFFFQKGSAYQHLLHLLKYNLRQDIGRALGRCAAAELLEEPSFRAFDYVVPVPLHANRLRQRGYNQSECIAEGLAAVLQVPMETETLFRAIENPTQTKKSVYERWENTVGIFDLHNRATFEGKHILLVDDVLTTGSTLIACVQALKQCRCRVSVFTLASA